MKTGAEVCTAEQAKTKRYSSFLLLIHTDQSGGLVGTLAFEPDGLKHREQDEAEGRPRNRLQNNRKKTKKLRKLQRLKSRADTKSRTLFGALVC